MDSLTVTVDQAIKAWEDLLTVMAELDDKYYPPREERTAGWKAPFQVRCEGCGRFAAIERSGDGYDARDGTYEPWFTVNCKRCGEENGFIPE